jgi:succinate dehydrogenase / fumarate reductase, cytochrome b subunit
MSWFRNYAKSSVGAKHIMALTGIILSVFVLGHMLGNLQIFLGPDAINSYAESLKGNFPLLWGTRVVLLIAVVTHIAASLRLVALNRAARPVRYHVFRPSRSPFYARVMPWTGLILLAFIIYHIMHFTLGQVMPDAFASREVIDVTTGATRHDVYTMTVLGFQSYAVSFSYIVAMAILCMHLAHGVSSLFQSLGLRHPKYNALIRNAGPVFGWLIFIGNSSMPIAVMAGLVTLPGA